MVDVSLVYKVGLYNKHAVVRKGAGLNSALQLLFEGHYIIMYSKLVLAAANQTFLYKTFIVCLIDQCTYLKEFTHPL